MPLVRQAVHLLVSKMKTSSLHLENPLPEELKSYESECEGYWRAVGGSAHCTLLAMPVIPSHDTFVVDRAEGLEALRRMKAANAENLFNKVSRIIFLADLQSVLS